MVFGNLHQQRTAIAGGVAYWHHLHALLAGLKFRHLTTNYP